ncbi:MAG: hypothetical protein ACKVPX_15560 [Myxococcaceae bacterium]
MIRTLLLVGTFFVSTVTGGALAQSTDSSAQDAAQAGQIDGYLGAIHSPPGADTWRALGPAALARLREHLDNPQAQPTLRARAADALATVGGPQDADRLAAWATDATAPQLLRERALVAAHALLTPAAGHSMVLRALDDARSPGLRAAAAGLLARTPNADGCNLLRARAAQQAGKDRVLFKRALKLCAAPPK